MWGSSAVRDRELIRPPPEPADSLPDCKKKQNTLINMSIDKLYWLKKYIGKLFEVAFSSVDWGLPTMDFLIETLFSIFLKRIVETGYYYISRKKKIFAHFPGDVFTVVLTTRSQIILDKSINVDFWLFKT